ncbi:MAG: phage tail protein, partial [Abditibacteriota bacterium]|nr:phage tail protein [Abditibacteriota bacterium]
RGVEDVDSFTYNAYYTHADYAALKALEGKQELYAEWYGASVNAQTGVVTPDGHDGKFSFTGELSVYPNGGGVNDPRSMTITISVNSKVLDETSS